MKIKTTLTAIVLVLSPAWAIAACSGDHASQATMSCAEGMTLNTETGACETSVTG